MAALRRDKIAELPRAIATLQARRDEREAERDAALAQKACLPRFRPSSTAPLAILARCSSRE
ncbi:MAG: hypothetical protein EXR07_18355 [Acetobacteraceae bacterium]|nr:hypothetical protein [Acetobacteraceae bacterium]